jgi:hypothetical protein
MKSVCSSALAVWFVSLGGVAFAETLIDATDPGKIAELARGYGSVNLSKDDQGDPMILGRINGTKYAIFFYGCDEAKDCRDIQFRASWEGMEHVTPENMLKWNLEKRFGSAYIDRDGDPTIDWDVNLYAGVSRDNLDDSIDWWVVTLKEFTDFLKSQ